MDNYIKPSIKLVADSGAKAGTGSCGTSGEDMQLIQSIIGGADASSTFGMGEPCTIQIPLDMFCKFTSTELGATQIFWS